MTYFESIVRLYQTSKNLLQKFGLDYYLVINHTINISNLYEIAKRIRPPPNTD